LLTPANARGKRSNRCRAKRAIAALAVEMAHRPDLDIRWTALRVFMTTHTAGDVVTELDLATAARLDAIAAAHGAAGL